MRKEKIRLQILRDKEVKMKHILSDIEEEDKQILTASNNFNPSFNDKSSSFMQTHDDNYNSNNNNLN